jgi:hypothetical protein
MIMLNRENDVFLHVQNFKFLLWSGLHAIRCFTGMFCERAFVLPLDRAEARDTPAVWFVSLVGDSVLG